MGITNPEIPEFVAAVENSLFTRINSGDGSVFHGYLIYKYSLSREFSEAIEQIGVTQYNQQLFEHVINEKPRTHALLKIEKSRWRRRMTLLVGLSLEAEKKSPSGRIIYS